MINYSKQVQDSTWICHEVDRPIFTLFGVDYDNDVTTKCGKCSQLVGYDNFVFSDKTFYHIGCYYVTK